MNKIISFRCNVNYAQVFERNRDMGGEGNEAAETIANRGGLYKINCYPPDRDWETK